MQLTNTKTFNSSKVDQLNKVNGSSKLEQFSNNVANNNANNVINNSVDSKLSNHEIINITENVRDEMTAGIEPITILRNSAKNSSNKKFAAILNAIATKIENGHSFTEAINSFPKAFPEFYRALIAAAEQTGNWTSAKAKGKPGILDMILSQLKRDEKVRSKVTSAMLYPAFILGIISLALLILTFFVLPKMRDFFTALDMEKNLNFASRALLATGDFIAAYYYAIPVVLIAAALAVVLFWRTAGNRLWQEHCFNFYLIGKTIKKLTVANNFSLLATLQEAGLPAAETVRILANTNTNKFVKVGLEEAYKKVLAGKNFSENIRDSHPVFINEPYQVLSSAERTGNLSDRPATYAQSLFNRVEEEIDNLIAIIPSVLLVFVGIIVAFIVVAFYGSFFGAIGQLSGY